MGDDRRRDAPEEPTTGQRVARELANLGTDTTISVPAAGPELVAAGLAQLAAERQHARGSVAFDPLGATLDHTSAAPATPDAPAPLAGGTLDLPASDQVARGGELDPGQLVGRFVIRARLGEGGMGVVLAAHDPDLGRAVAIKIVKTAADHPGYRARLLREAQVMARLEHPNVLRVHEVGTDRGRLYVAMEYVDGVTLHTWCKVERRRWREVLAMYQQVGRGLAAVHAAGLVHRDFKPDNVLVDRDGRARVADFGLARLDPDRTTLPPELGASLTRTGMMVGTPAYMAPEQHFGGDVDARADQYSFCVSLREALIGSRPIKIEDAHWGDVPRAVRAIIDRGAAVDVNERFPSMDVLLVQLARAARRRKLYAAAAAAVLLAGGLAGAAVVMTSDDDATRATDTLADTAGRASLSIAANTAGTEEANARTGRTGTAANGAGAGIGGSDGMEASGRGNGVGANGIAVRGAGAGIGGSDGMEASGRGNGVGANGIAVRGAGDGTDEMANGAGNTVRANGAGGANGIAANGAGTNGVANGAGTNGAANGGGANAGAANGVANGAGTNGGANGGGVNGVGTTGGASGGANGGRANSGGANGAGTNGGANGGGANSVRTSAGGSAAGGSTAGGTSSRTSAGKPGGATVGGGTQTVGTTVITPMAPVKETDAARKHNREGDKPPRHEMPAAHRAAVRDAVRDFGYLGVTITGNDRDADLRDLEAQLAAATDDLTRGMLVYGMGQAERSRDDCIAAVKHWAKAKQLVLAATKGPMDATIEQRRNLAFLFYGRSLVGEAYCDLAGGRALGVDEKLLNASRNMWAAGDAERAEVWFAMGIAMWETGEEDQGKQTLLQAVRRGGTDRLRAAIDAYARAVGLKL